MLFKKKYSYLSMVCLYMRSVPWMAFVKVLAMIVGAVIPTLNILLTANFIDNSIAVVSASGDLAHAVVPLIGIVLIRLFQNYAGVIIDLLNTKSINKLKTVILPEIIERKASVKYKYYENEDCVDIMNRVTGGFIDNVIAFFDQLSNALVTISYIVGFVIVLGMQMWWATLLFVIMAIPAFVIAYRFGKKRYDIDKEMSKVDRRAWYISGVLSGRESVDERCLYGYTDILDKEYRINYEKARTARQKITKEMWANITIAGMLIFASGIIVVALLLPRLLTTTGETVLSVGMFISLVNSIFGLSQQLKESIPDHINAFRYHFEFLKELNVFITFETQNLSTCLPADWDDMLFPIKTLEFRHVYFKYPDCDTYVLRDFCLTLQAGKTYSLVGVNGAGKTTIVKLITGLYDTYEGEILINGKDLRSIELPQLKSLTAIIYQDFCKYPMSIYDNIAIGDINNANDRKRVEDAANVMGLIETIKRLPEGIDTPISKITEDGVELSGGEWQRVALARLLVSKRPIKILDEPTASLDPIAESKMLGQYREIMKTKTRDESITVFISHRLGSTKLSDTIVVIDEGSVKESGTYSDLIKRNGLFAQMYQSQAQWYQK